jgi:hypothetical protein
MCGKTQKCGAHCVTNLTREQLLWRSPWCWLQSLCQSSPSPRRPRSLRRPKHRPRTPFRIADKMLAAPNRCSVPGREYFQQRMGLWEQLPNVGHQLRAEGAGQ